MEVHVPWRTGETVSEAVGDGDRDGDSPTGVREGEATAPGSPTHAARNPAAATSAIHRGNPRKRRILIL